MVIYADEIFIINFISAYIMLYILGKVINKVRIRKKRIIAAALLGAALAAIIFCAEMPMWIAYMIRIGSVFLMIFTAFFELRKQILHQFIWFLLMTGIMMFSMILILAVFKNAVGAAIKAGILYFNISSEVFILTFAASYLVMIFFIKVFKNRKNKKYYIMSVTHNDKTVTVSALFDSGNLLKEPITGKYVSILEWEEAKKLFDADYEFSDIENHAEDMKLWVIPFNSLGNPTGIIFAFLADSITIPEENKTVDKTFIGIYGNKLSKNKEYHALINAGLL